MTDARAVLAGALRVVWRFDVSSIDALVAGAGARTPNAASATRTRVQIIARRTERLTRRLLRVRRIAARLCALPTHPGDTCLVRASAVVHAVRAAGHEAVLRFGAHRDREIHAHAWAEWSGVPLTDPGVAMTPFVSSDAR